MDDGGIVDQRQGRQDNPGVLCWGPVLAFGPFVAGLIVDQVVPIAVLGSIGRSLRLVIALFLLTLGAWFLWTGNMMFRRAGTAFEPWKPTSALATEGVYGRTRNPMYQGFFLLVHGLAFLLRSD